MTHSSQSADERSDRILGEKLRLLFKGNFAVPANVAIACVVAFLLRRTFPHALLMGWIAATALVAGARILLPWWFRRLAPDAAGTARCAFAFTTGSLLSGALWGVLCLGLPLWGNAHDFVLLTLVAAGMSAGALTTISAYLPAFLAYAVPFVMPLAVVSLLNRDPYVAANGGLVLLYIGIISLAARNLARSVDQTIALKVDNETLQTSLNATRVERDAARKEKWSAIAQLSHELRTPLNAILGFSEIMGEEYYGPLGDERYRECAAHVRTGGHHLLTVADEILQLSQGEAGRLELNESTVDLAAVIRDCLDIMTPTAEKAELSLKASVSPQLPALRADQSKVRRMLFTLVDNAIKFTPPGGRVSIHALRTADRGIDLLVRDTGIGIKAEDIPLVLQPFARAGSQIKNEGEGAGFGLPICKRLAELHGAELTINSAVGEGTVCTISFPASRCDVRPAAENAAA